MILFHALCLLILKLGLYFQLVYVIRSFSVKYVFHCLQLSIYAPFNIEVLIS